MKLATIYPRTLFSEENTLSEQIDHILSEIEEVKREVPEVRICFDSDSVSEMKIPMNLLHELADLQHSIETLWRVIDRVYGDGYTMKRIIVPTVIKNRARGYYPQF